MQEKRTINYYLSQYSRMMRKDTKDMVKLLGTDLLGYVKLGEVEVPDMECNFIRNMDKICEKHKVQLETLVNIINEIQLGYVMAAGTGKPKRYWKCRDCHSVTTSDGDDILSYDNCPGCHIEMAFEEVDILEFCKLANIACQPR